MGGQGGNKAENGGPGTIFLQMLPPDNKTLFLDATLEEAQITHSSNITDKLTNRTLLIGNGGRSPKDEERSLKKAYFTDFGLGTATAWVIADDLPEFAKRGIKSRDSSDFVIDELRVYSKAHVAFVSRHCLTCHVSVRVKEIDGDRNGRLHIGFNQSLFIVNGRIPVDLSVYQGGEATLRGELRVVGVTVMIQGVLRNVDRMTIEDKGK